MALLRSVFSESCSSCTSCQFISETAETNHGLADRREGKSGRKISAPSAISCSKRSSGLIGAVHGRQARTPCDFTGGQTQKAKPPRQVPGREVAGIQLAPGGRVQTPLRNMESTAVTTMESKASREDRF